MAPVGGVLAPAVMRALRQAAVSTAKISRLIQTKLSQPLAREAEHATVLARVTVRQPIHPAAALRRSRRGGARWSSTASYNRLNAALRRFISSASGPAPRPTPFLNTAAFAKTQVGRAFAQFPGRTPFAHTLRPNLTGGALPRTAGGYAMPGSGRVGGQRFFSHAPASQAQVVQNVSQAMRAFWLSGHRAHFDGYGTNGAKLYRPVSALSEDASAKVAKAPSFASGSYIEFRLNPTVTALGSLAGPSPVLAVAGVDYIPKVDAATLNAEGFLDVLSTDFARQLKDLTSIMSDLKRLAAVGDLPVVLEKNHTLRVRFPGLDAETVERLCDDIGIQRGTIRQDPNFDTDHGLSSSLRFPFAPDTEHLSTAPLKSSKSCLSDLSSIEENEALFDDYVMNNPWLSCSSSEALFEEGYGSLSPPLPSSGEDVSEDLEGLEGIYRFLEECDHISARPRF
ncbi:hypothetical protein BD289DRAFT_455833 [Coniella lustricola]|uniref:Casein kinase II beta 2 subunit n=1 Tax=Coniella lustricola TaxID=2025994 RepID=A0A2T2ZYB1_9PEZI|nr:hypothetical protein BD289DRAFT_455833 [Coniella lustricola]